MKIWLLRKCFVLKFVSRINLKCFPWNVSSMFTWHIFIFFRFIYLFEHGIWHTNQQHFDWLVVIFKSLIFSLQTLLHVFTTKNELFVMGARMCSCLIKSFVLFSLSLALWLSRSLFLRLFNGTFWKNRNIIEFRITSSDERFPSKKVISGNFWWKSSSKTFNTVVKVTCSIFKGEHIHLACWIGK